MGRAGCDTSAYLALDDVAEDPQVARRLPPDIAWRLHALPVAEDHGQITVAMADPEDADARDAVVAALGTVACVVRADPAIIHSHLARLWGEPGGRGLDVVACCFPQPLSGEVLAYAQAVSDLLRARLGRAQTQADLGVALGEGGEPQADVVLLGDAGHAAIASFLARAAAAAQPGVPPVPAALWVVPHPRWPLHRILLVITGTAGDDAAVDWVVRIARPGLNPVTVLTIVPPAPAMYGRRGRMEQGLPALLTSASPLGHTMREVAHRLVECQLEATLRLRAGPPEWLICQEIVEGDYDLVVLAAERSPRWLRWLEGGLVGPLLCRIDRPVLIAAHTASHEPPG